MRCACVLAVVAVALLALARAQEMDLMAVEDPIFTEADWETNCVTEGGGIYQHSCVQVGGQDNDTANWIGHRTFFVSNDCNDGQLDEDHTVPPNLAGAARIHFRMTIHGDAVNEGWKKMIWHLDYIDFYPVLAPFVGLLNSPNGCACDGTHAVHTTRRIVPSECSEGTCNLFGTSGDVYFAYQSNATNWALSDEGFNETAWESTVIEDELTPRDQCYNFVDDLQDIFYDADADPIFSETDWESGCVTEGGGIYQHSCVEVGGEHNNSADWIGHRTFFLSDDCNDGSLDDDPDSSNLPENLAGAARIHFRMTVHGESDTPPWKKMIWHLNYIDFFPVLAPFVGLLNSPNGCACNGTHELHKTRRIVPSECAEGTCNLFGTSGDVYFAYQSNETNWILSDEGFNETTWDSTIIEDSLTERPHCYNFIKELSHAFGETTSPSAPLAPFVLLTALLAVFALLF